MYFFATGILQPPLFKKDYPDFHNFGSMGYIMGHEMVHAFDYNGAKYDSEGNLRVQASLVDLWTCC